MEIANCSFTNSAGATASHSLNDDDSNDAMLPVEQVIECCCALCLKSSCVSCYTAIGMFNPLQVSHVLLCCMLQFV